jgi:hypothetical protein
LAARGVRESTNPFRVATDARAGAAGEARRASEERTAMTVLWFVIWLICDLIGDREPLRFDPVNWWAATLLLAIALDLSRPDPFARRAR